MMPTSFIALFLAFAVSELIEGLRDDDADFLHRLVLGLRGLRAPTSLCSCMAELDVEAEIIRACPHAPRNHWFRQASVLDSRDDVVLIHTTNLSEQNDHLALGIR